MKIRPFRDWSLRVKVLLILVLSAAIPLLVAGYISVETMRGETIQHARFVLNAWVQIVQQQLDEFHRVNLEQALRLKDSHSVQVFAEDGIVNPGLVRAFESAEENYKKAYGADSERENKLALHGIGLVDVRGDVRCGIGLLKHLKSRIDTSEFVNAYLRECLTLNKATISDLYFPQEFQSKAVIAYAQPVVDKDDKVVAAVVCWADADSMWGILRRFRDEKGLPKMRVEAQANVKEEAYLSLFDIHGVRIAHSWGDEMEFHPAGEIDPQKIKRMVDENRFGAATDRLNNVLPFLANFKRATKRKLEKDDESFEPREGYAFFVDRPNYGVARRLKTREAPWTLFFQAPEENMFTLGGTSLYGTSTTAMFTIAFLLAAPLTGLLIVGLGIWIVSHMLKPVGDLSAAMQKFGEGDLTKRVPVQASDELGTMAAGFNDMARRLQEAILAHDRANNAKSALIRNVSHELRSPLTAIKGYCEELQDQAREKSDQGMLDDLNVIHAQAIQLNNLVDDLLMISRIDADKLEFKLQLFEVGDVAGAAITACLPRASSRNNRVVFDGRNRLGSMHGDMGRLRQCLDNLLSNACKFTENGTVCLTVSSVNVAGEDGLAFKVEDTGIGIKPALLSRLFELFAQGDERKEGSGLGLSITRMLARKMGGDVIVTSTEGQGSTFTLLLPRDMRRALPDAKEVPANETLRMNDTHPILPAIKSTPEAGAPQHTILVIDDDPNQLEMLQRVLVKEGFQVQTCSSGAEGLRLARQIRPHAITLDVLMPTMDGWAVLSALKADPSLAEIPVIMLTIVDDKKSQALALGASDFLTKPLDRNRLLDVLHRRCSSSGQQRRALIAEDEPAIRELLRRSLLKGGWQVAEAADGKQALDSVKTAQPELILLDLMMPEMNGFEFLAELRSNPQWQSIPIVVLTARDLTTEDRQLLERFRLFDERIFKKGSFPMEELLEEIHGLASARVQEA